MPLPLMPGSEPLPEIKPVPDVPPTAMGNSLAGVGGALAGCGCEACNDMRQRFNNNIPRREVNAPQWMQQAYAANIDNLQRAAGAFPAPVFDWGNQEAPRQVGVNAGRIRGRYTSDRAANMGMAGDERWLDPALGSLFGSDGARTNSGLTAQPDGTWRSASGMIWEAT